MSIALALFIDASTNSYSAQVINNKYSYAEWYSAFDHFILCLNITTI